MNTGYCFFVDMYGIGAREPYVLRERHGSGEALPPTPSMSGPKVITIWLCIKLTIRCLVNTDCIFGEGFSGVAEPISKFEI